MQKLKIGEIDGVTCPSNNPPSIAFLSSALARTWAADSSIFECGYYVLLIKYRSSL